MGRRTILLILAAVVAVAGAAMVFLYVQGADERAKEGQAPVPVLKAVAQIEPGESLSDAQAAGKFELLSVPAEQRLEGALDSVGSSGGLVALQRIYVNEQITSSKFGTQADTDVLGLPDGRLAISVNLSDTGRVAGFVSPGSEVALFYSGPAGAANQDRVRVLLPQVEVIAVGQTTVTTATTTTPEGAATTEQLPLTLFTLAVNQKEAEKIVFASTHGELVFGLLNDKSKVSPGPGVSQQNLFG